MANTMSCGELKEIRFVSNNSKVELNGKKGQSLSKVNKKRQEENKKSDAPQTVYKLKGGARIIKLDSVGKYKEFKKELQKLVDKSPKSMDLYNKPLSEILKQFEGVYDGIMVGDELAKQSKDPLLKEAGIKIFNTDVIIEEGEKDDGPYRTGFKAFGTEVNGEMKALATQVFENVDALTSSYANHLKNMDYKITYDGDKHVIKDQEQEQSFNESIKELSGMISNKVEVDLVGDSSQRDGKTITLSAKECMMITKVANEVNNLNLKTPVTMDDAVLAMGLYLQSDSENNFVKSAKAIEDLKAKTITSGDGYLRYDASKEELKEITKEILHREKQVWEKVIERAPDDKKEQIRQIACIKIAEKTQLHYNVAKKSATLVIGDMSIAQESQENTKMRSSFVKKGTFKKLFSSMLEMMSTIQNI